MAHSSHPQSLAIGMRDAAHAEPRKPDYATDWRKLVPLVKHQLDCGPLPKFIEALLARAEWLEEDRERLLDINKNLKDLNVDAMWRVQSLESRLSEMS